MKFYYLWNSRVKYEIKLEFFAWDLLFFPPSTPCKMNSNITYNIHCVEGKSSTRLRNQPHREIVQKTKVEIARITRESISVYARKRRNKDDAWTIAAKAAARSIWSSIKTCSIQRTSALLMHQLTELEGYWQVFGNVLSHDINTISIYYDASFRLLIYILIKNIIAHIGDIGRIVVQSSSSLILLQLSWSLNRAL